MAVFLRFGSYMSRCVSMRRQSELGVRLMEATFASLNFLRISTTSYFEQLVEKVSIIITVTTIETQTLFTTFLTMFKPQALRTTIRATRQSYISAARPAAHQIRSLTATTSWRRATDKELDAASTSGAPGESGDHEGQHARTESITFEHPEEHEMPREKPVTGRGGDHNLRTLASFSLEGKTAVITGGARGLGLVMTQALVISGADVAIVDLNSEFTNHS